MYDVRNAVADCQLAIADGFGTARDIYLHTENFGCVVSISQCFEFVLTSDVDGNVACSGLVLTCNGKYPLFFNGQISFQH